MGNPNDTSHLAAIELRLSHERARFRKATTDVERQYRTVLVQQVEKELASEKEFLGVADEADVTMTDEELLRELGV